MNPRGRDVAVGAVMGSCGQSLFAYYGWATASRPALIIAAGLIALAIIYTLSGLRNRYEIRKRQGNSDG